MLNLSTGIQDFVKLRQADMVYVDKTMHMMSFLSGGAFFLARPRRFGKSLLLSTLKAAFMGRKDLFSGLWLEQHFDFTPRPVIRLDLSKLDYTARSLETSLLEDFRQTAREYNITLQQNTAKSAFEELILELAKSARVAVLIDEYDKPLTDFLLEPEKREQHQATLKAVYGVLKPLDAYLHLVLLTGVSKIGKLSLFSDLNNLSDISLAPAYTQICGYTRAEIETHFSAWLEPIAKRLDVTLEQLWEAITRWYNGYSWDGVHKLYCPFSFLIFLERQEFASFWYETGTPTLLTQMIKSGQVNPTQLERVFVAGEAISVLDVNSLDLFSLMFQTGYLTITDIKRSLYGADYTLSYPNFEVRTAFSRSLLEEYSRIMPTQVSSFALTLQRALLALDFEQIFSTCNRIFASVPYEIFPAKEAYLHSLMHLMLASSGFVVQSQVQTSLGRLDTLVKTPTHSIILEFKSGGSAKEALAQIEQMRYADALEGEVVKVGVVFDFEQKSILEWAVG